MKTSEINKTLPQHYRSRTWYNKICMLCKCGVGHLYKLTGKEPPFPCTPNLAADKWIHWLCKQPLPPVNGSIAILAVRNQTWMDWALYAACWMRRLGLAPIVLFSGNDAQKVYGGCRSPSMKQRFLTYKFWDHVYKIPDVITVDIDKLPEAALTDTDQFSLQLSTLAHTNAAYELYVEEYEQGEFKEKYDQLAGDIHASMIRETCQAYRLLCELKKLHGFNRIIGASGIIGRSACYECAAQAAGLSRTWVEGWSIRPGLMRWNFDKPALDFDTHNWVENLSWDSSERNEAKQMLSFQETGNANAKADKKSECQLNYQIVSSDIDLPDSLATFVSKDSRPIFLLASNVVGDSATFQRQTIFKSQREWIRSVVEYFKIHQDIKLIVRAHPSERVYALHDTLRVNLGAVATEAAKGIENIHVVQWHDKVNTYSLLPHIRAGLNWVSNLGADLVARGIPVVSAARPVYDKLAITEMPASVNEYFRLIEMLSKSSQIVAEDKRETAVKYLYVIYKKIGMLGTGPRGSATDLMLDHLETSEYGAFYKIIAGLRSASVMTLN